MSKTDKAQRTITVSFRLDAGLMERIDGYLQAQPMRITRTAFFEYALMSALESKLVKETSK